MAENSHDAVAENTVRQPRQIGTNDDEAGDRIEIIELLITLGEYKTFLIGFPLVASVIAAIVSLMLPASYTAATTFLPPQQQQSTAASALQQLGGLTALAGAAAGIKKPDELYVVILKSETIQNALIERFDLMKRYGAALHEDARKELAGSVDIILDKAGLLRVEVTETDPQFAAQLANAHVEELRKRLMSMAVTEAQQRRAFFEQQLLASKEALIKAEIGLRQTQERTGLIALDKQGEAIIKASADLRAQIVSREVQLQAMRNFATPQNADVQRIESEIAGLKAQLARVESGQVRGQGDIIIPTGRVPQAGLEIVRSLREVKYQEAIFELLARQFEMAKLDEAREGPVVQPVDVATPPERRSKPKRRQIVFTAGMAAGLFAVFSVLLLTALRRTRADPLRWQQFERLWSTWRFRPKSR